MVYFTHFRKSASVSLWRQANINVTGGFFLMKQNVTKQIDKVCNKNTQLKCGKVKINPSKSFLKVLLTEKTSVKKGKSFSRDLKVKKITKGHAICPS